MQKDPGLETHKMEAICCLDIQDPKKVTLNRKICIGPVPMKTKTTHQVINVLNP